MDNPFFLDSKKIQEKAEAEKIAQLEKAEMERYESIVKEINEILVKNNVTVKELPIIVSVITGRINKKFDESTIDSMINKK